jgi:hypothetical protein
MSATYKNNDGRLRAEIAELFDVPQTLLAPVRPRRRRLRHIVPLQWLVPVLFAQMVTLLLIVFLGAPEFRLPAFVFLVAIVLWLLIYGVSAIVSDLARVRRFRARDRALQTMVSSSIYTPNQVREAMGLKPPPDPWAHVRDRDD